MLADAIKKLVKYANKIMAGLRLRLTSLLLFILQYVSLCTVNDDSIALDELYIDKLHEDGML